jgi:hypothetical protein
LFAVAGKPKANSINTKSLFVSSGISVEAQSCHICRWDICIAIRLSSPMSAHIMLYVRTYVRNPCLVNRIPVAFRQRIFISGQSRTTYRPSSSTLSSTLPESYDRTPNTLKSITTNDIPSLHNRMAVSRHQPANELIEHISRAEIASCQKRTRGSTSALRDQSSV